MDAHRMPLVSLSRRKRHIMTFLAAVTITWCSGSSASFSHQSSRRRLQTPPPPPPRTVTGSVWLFPQPDVSHWQASMCGFGLKGPVLRVRWDP